MASLTVSPHMALADQQVTILAKGLQAGGKYTLQALVEREPFIYQSYAHYIADDTGTIDVTKMTSHGGSYVGVEPMGLIWFLEALIPGGGSMMQVSKFFLRNDREMLIDIFLHEGHVTPVEDAAQIPPEHALAKVKVERYTVHPDVTRIEVRQGQLRGTLYVPKGQGPYLGILDIYGAIREIVYERRAALLAARGYVTFALGYVEFEGTPDMNNLQMEYFLEAVDFLYNHPKVAKCGLAIASECFGGCMAMLLAAYTDKIKAILAINSFGYLTGGRMFYRGQKIDGSDKVRTPDEIFSAEITPQTYRVDYNKVRPVEEHPADIHYLFIAGAKDGLVHPDHSRELARRLQRAGRKHVKVVVYPGLGHDYSQPYTPMVKDSFEINDRFVPGGGSKYDHERALESAWTMTLEFFDQCRLRFNLGNHSHL